MYELRPSKESRLRFSLKPPLKKEGPMYQSCPSVPHQAGLKELMGGVLASRSR
jgi:hypothetical protein